MLAPNLSRLMTTYNAARRLHLDRGRLNRALGICMRRTAPELDTYRTSCTSCQCPDYRYHGAALCKHIIARNIARIAAEGD